MGITLERGRPILRVVKDQKNEFKKAMFVCKTGFDNLVEIRQFPPKDMDMIEWNKYVDSVTDPKNITRAEMNKINQSKQEYSSVLRTRYTEEIFAFEHSDETQVVNKLNALRTLESFVIHSNFDIPSETIYYIPEVLVNVLLVKGNVFDSIDACIITYM
ncbi:hypothetical protein Tco_0307562, partial [Tanacetum coccineum]